ncbi:hypothetical protein [Streptomyces glaucus]|uniref:Uncharacterized protein n=1 Tax=Streptomyces glaucus TaxID=284029 RepID=A0ABN3KHZ4_9ACTN
MDLHPRPLPANTEPDALQTGDRDLALLAALADHWDTVPHPPCGKIVRAVLTTPVEA